MNRNLRRPGRRWILRAAAAFPLAALCLGLANPAFAAPATPASVSAAAVSGAAVSGAAVSGAAAPASGATLTASATSVPNGSTITFTYSTPAATNSSTNWIGLYEPGQTPGDVGSTTWQYTPGTSGTATFSAANLDGVGDYVAYYLYNDGYQVLAGPLSFSVVPSQPAAAPRFAAAFGAAGAGRLSGPAAVAAAPDGSVWVADTGGNRIEHFSAGGHLLRSSGGGLDRPAGIAVDPAGQVWVSDTGHDRIVEFSAAGVRLTAFGSAGPGPGQLDQPLGLAVSGSGDVLVADLGNNRIEEFSSGGSYVSSISVATPADLAFDEAGDIWVSSPSYAAGNAVYEFSPSGTQLANYNSTQASFGALSNPAGIDVGPDGRVYVVQPDYGWVTVYNPDGSFYTEFGLQHSPARASENLSFARGLAIGSDGTVWVADTGHNRIVRFSPAGHASAGHASAGHASAAAVYPLPRRRDDSWLLAGLVVLLFAGLTALALGLRRRVRAASPAIAAAARPAGAVPAGAVPAGAVPAGAVPSAAVPSGAVPSGAVPSGAVPAGAVPSGAVPSGAAPAAAVPAAAVPAGAVPASAVPAEAWPEPAGPATGQPATGGYAAPGGGQQVIVSRRSLLTGATALTGLAAGGAVLPLNLRKALATSLAATQRGSISDIRHIVILMQENRSFDHYFGTMPGVRGFADPAALRLPTGNPVFYQPDSSHAQGYLLPFHYDTKTTSAQATPGTDHSWPTQHQAWNNGQMDQWIPAKGPFTMGYFKQQDIPFHWALAEAFTICDNYHCSVLGPTNPNRLYMWTGMIDPNGTGGGPIIDNSPAFNNVILSWTTYPERLERAGISWRVYQEEDNFDDNSLAWFKQYSSAPSSSPLRQQGIAFGQAGDFEADARAGRLPQVSWLVAPTAQTEHPDFFPAAGAEYIAQKLDAIASNPDVWAKTAFILCYDENDGMFDHVSPPTPPPGTPDEFVQGEPIGLGFRTPTTIVSPWTAGGFVCSGVFDHTSLIRFIEARFGVHEPNISAWRRQTCGDLTSAFRFARRPASYPQQAGELRLAVTESRLLRAQRQVNDNPAPVIPAVNEPLPPQ